MTFHVYHTCHMYHIKHHIAIAEISIHEEQTLLLKKILSMVFTLGFTLCKNQLTLQILISQTLHFQNPQAFNTSNHQAFSLAEY